MPNGGENSPHKRRNHTATKGARKQVRIGNKKSGTHIANWMVKKGGNIYIKAQIKD